jgi:hypothetical protein
MLAFATWAVGQPWYVVALIVVLFRFRVRFARNVEGKKVRTELEIGFNLGKPRPPTP